MNGAALPSMIGTSAELSSTTTLSTPRLTSAASRCSTVLTFTVSEARPVARLIAPRWLMLAATSRPPRSERRKRMPKSEGAGLRESVTFLPEWRPIPAQVIGRRRVRCAFISECTVCGVPVTKQAECPRAAFLITPPKLLRRLQLADTLPRDAIDRASRCCDPTTAARAQVVASLTQQDRAETETLSRSVLRV